ncbi:hypothetical protein MOQ_010206 [Trypanosoma cruzi marinkellei]|uniref:Uncharacterized protein n=1 Tax=Trypanosoma cruzi marinkellei TaxID=85056 RepID=K2NAU0_TRYCR|nr:hypothetical protein MOQ_010206 [Trypanosoma cruzi marinkellei]
MPTHKTTNGRQKGTAALRSTHTLPPVVLLLCPPGAHRPAQPMNPPPSNTQRQRHVGTCSCWAGIAPHSSQPSSMPLHSPAARCQQHARCTSRGQTAGSRPPSPRGTTPWQHVRAATRATDRHSQLRPQCSVWATSRLKATPRTAIPPPGSRQMPATKYKPFGAAEGTHQQHTASHHRHHLRAASRTNQLPSTQCGDEERDESHRHAPAPRTTGVTHNHRSASQARRHVPHLVVLPALVAAQQCRVAGGVVVLE